MTQPKCTFFADRLYFVHETHVPHVHIHEYRASPHNGALVYDVYCHACDDVLRVVTDLPGSMLAIELQHCYIKRHRACAQGLRSTMYIGLCPDKSIYTVNTVDTRRYVHGGTHLSGE